MDQISGFEMPKYKCHKEVWALKIKKIEMVPETDKIFLVFTDERYSKREVTPEFFNKHQPQPGGYFVVYEDGYESWSPGGVFEAGYSLV